MNIGYNSLEAAARLSSRKGFSGYEDPAGREVLCQETEFERFKDSPAIPFKPFFEGNDIVVVHIFQYWVPKKRGRIISQKTNPATTPAKKKTMRR